MHEPGKAAIKGKTFSCNLSQMLVCSRMNFVYRVVKEKKESNSVEILPDDTFQLTRKKSGKRNIAQGISESCRLHQ